MQSPIRIIRTHVLGLSQAALAQIAGTTQASVSRWEAGEQHPSHLELSAIRAEIVRRGIDWDDRWFFEAKPASTPEAAA